MLGNQQAKRSLGTEKRILETRIEAYKSELEPINKIIKNRAGKDFKISYIY